MASSSSEPQSGNPVETRTQSSEDAAPSATGGSSPERPHVRSEGLPLTPGSLPARPQLAAGQDEWMYLSDDDRGENLLRKAILPPANLSSGILPAIPGYEIVAELGRGGMGVVYKAWQVRLQRFVALKMILAGAYATPEQMIRFLAEAETLAKLHHPNIVKIHEIGTHEKRPYFALEFIDGVKLADLLGGVPQPPEAAAALIEKVARAIHFAHEYGIIHRDLKPSNILLQIADGHSLPAWAQATPDIGAAMKPITQSEICNLEHAIPKITDFGLAKHATAGAGLTRSHEVLGTAPYMAPEQAQGRARDVGPAADIYSLGSILYETLTGRPPFRAANPMETMVQVMTLEPLPVSTLQPKTPRDLVTICMKCLEKDTRKRYATAEALADDLRHFLSNEPVAARSAGPLERLAKWARRRPASAALVASLLAALLLGTAGAFWAWYNAAMARDAFQRMEADARRARDEARDIQWRSVGEIDRLRAALALASLAVGDDPRYCQLCAALMEHCQQTGDADGIALAVRIAALRPGAVADPPQLVHVAESALRSDATNAALLEALGMAQYRASNLTAAEERLSAALELRKRASSLSVETLFFLAMTQQRVGKGEQAKQALSQAIADMDKSKNATATDRAVWRRLRQEVEELMHGQK